MNSYWVIAEWDGWIMPMAFFKASSEEEVLNSFENDYIKKYNWPILNGYRVVQKDLLKLI